MCDARSGRISACLLSLMLSGCAGLDFKTIKNTGEDAVANGIRYYDTSPFLLIYTDGKGGLISKLLYLPDTTKLRSVHPYNYLAKNDSTLKFEDGRLMQAKSTIDETIVPAAVVSNLEKVALSATKAANAGKETIPGPYLFRITHANGKWELKGDIAKGTGGTSDAEIRFTSK